MLEEINVGDRVRIIRENAARGERYTYKGRVEWVSKDRDRPALRLDVHGPLAIYHFGGWTHTVEKIEEARP